MFSGLTQPPPSPPALPMNLGYFRAAPSPQPSGFPSPPPVSFPRRDERFALCGPSMGARKTRDRKTWQPASKLLHTASPSPPWGRDFAERNFRAFEPLNLSWSRRTSGARTALSARTGYLKNTRTKLSALQAVRRITKVQGPKLLRQVLNCGSLVPILRGR